MLQLLIKQLQQSTITPLIILHILMCGVCRDYEWDEFDLLDAFKRHTCQSSAAVFACQKNEIGRTPIKVKRGSDA